MAPPRLYVGNCEVLILGDGCFEAPADVLRHVDGASARKKAIETWGKPTIQIDVNCFALRSPDGIALIDAGAGEFWGPAFGQARPALRAAGVNPDDVRRVLLTHLHDDHVLGLFDGHAPYFPRAEVWTPRRDLAFFTDPRAWEATPEARRGGFDMARQLQESYGSKIRTIPNGPILDGVEAFPLPGHTPGHTGYLVSDDNGGLLIWGDTLHLAGLQSADPKVGVVYDLDMETAALTREATLQRAADSQWIIAGGHVTGFGRVQRDENGFQIIAVAGESSQL
jgi:glyoxylase-like metal-dependent hydrolase (beta-lactamase superfamily II)